MSKRESIVNGAVLTMWFPFGDINKRKLRPVVIVSNENFHSIPFRYKEMTVALITSIAPPEIMKNYHILVKKGTKEYENGGLLRSSYIRLDKMFSTDERAINKFIGRFSSIYMDDISEKCKGIFDLK